MKAKAICDGRGNAGTGARACVLIVTPENGKTYEVEKAERIDPTTNIVAEHLAIQLAIEMAKEEGVTDLLILNDSQTPVYHVNGFYKVKQEHLLPIVKKTWDMALEFDKICISWVPREQTKRPDALCKQIDRDPAARPRPGGPVVRPSRRNPFLKG